MRIAAIDVGLTGGIAFAAYDRNRPKETMVLEDAMPMPILPGTRRGTLAVFPDFLAMRELFVQREVGCVVVELQQAMRKQGMRQGVSSTALLMRQFGLCEGVPLGLGLRTQLVSPRTWKKELGLEGHGKEVARQRAISIFPDMRHRFGRAQDHGPAEAALIAWWKVHHAADDDRPAVYS